MSRLFVSPSGRGRQRWQAAFADASVAADIAAHSGGDLSALGSVWLDLSAVQGAMRRTRVREAVNTGIPVIVMVATPREDDAFVLVQCGARGYCHVEAAPEQLREIALVVEHGGLWMPPELMRRVLAVSTRVVTTQAQDEPRLDELTARELMVAEQVARGATNREIAATLQISERTVKAHLTAIFEKLGVRDRVQLALAMNNIPTYSTVN